MRALSRQWFNIKQLIGLAKEAKTPQLRPLKYHIEVSQKYWDSIFKSEGITDRAGNRRRIVEEKRRIISTSSPARRTPARYGQHLLRQPNGDVQQRVVINKIDSDRRGRRLVEESHDRRPSNMICFTLSRPLRTRGCRARQGGRPTTPARQARAFTPSPRLLQNAFITNLFSPSTAS